MIKLQKNKLFTLGLLLFVSLGISAQTQSNALPKPSKNQLRWQDMEMYAFIHYSLNTYTDQEWGFGNEDPKLFNPSSLDCRQWARVCKQAGMRGIIFTAKHHCGFCMWPSAFTEYSVYFDGHIQKPQWCLAVKMMPRMPACLHTRTH